MLFQIPLFMGLLNVTTLDSENVLKHLWLACLKMYFKLF